MKQQERLERARLALDGLSVGDAFGERFFGPSSKVVHLIEQRVVPPPPWRYTDDTEMVLAIVEVLEGYERIDQAALAGAFARRYQRDPARGYGGMAHQILSDLGAGLRWQVVSHAAFDGAGSMGNGGAMRVAPVGAYFADDLDRVVAEAAASAEVTHAHPEGQAGALAVAVAAAMAWRTRGTNPVAAGRMLLETAWDRTPPGPTRDGLRAALELPADTPTTEAAEALGNGSRVISSDTVPLALFCAARHLGDYQAALWDTVSALGDRDTTCAIAGGVVVMFVGREGLPAEWLDMREPLDWGTP